MILFIGEFVLLYMVFEAVLYRKKAGLIYRITRSCSTKGKFYRLSLIFSAFLERWIKM